MQHGMERLNWSGVASDKVCETPYHLYKREYASKVHSSRWARISHSSLQFASSRFVMPRLWAAILLLMVAPSWEEGECMDLTERPAPMTLDAGRWKEGTARATGRKSDLRRGMRAHSWSWSTLFQSRRAHMGCIGVHVLV